MGEQFKATYLHHRVEESTSNTLFMRKGEFGDEECPSGENKVGAHNRNDSSDKGVGPVRRRRNDNGEKEACNGCCPSTHSYREMSNQYAVFVS